MYRETNLGRQRRLLRALTLTPQRREPACAKAAHGLRASLSG